MTTIWISAALGLLLALVPCLWVLARAQAMERFVAMQMAGTITPLVLFLLALGAGQASFADVAIALALLSFPAALLFAHFFERWL